MYTYTNISLLIVNSRQKQRHLQHPQLRQEYSIRAHMLAYMDQLGVARSNAVDVSRLQDVHIHYTIAIFPKGVYVRAVLSTMYTIRVPGTCTRREEFVRTHQREVTGSNSRNERHTILIAFRCLHTDTHQRHVTVQILILHVHVCTSVYQLMHCTCA